MPAASNFLMLWSVNIPTLEKSGVGSGRFRHTTARPIRAAALYGGTMFTKNLSSEASSARCAIWVCLHQFPFTHCATVSLRTCWRGLRHSNSTRTIGTQGCADHDDLHACAESRRARGAQSAGCALVARCDDWEVGVGCACAPRSFWCASAPYGCYSPSPLCAISV